MGTLGVVDPDAGGKSGVKGKGVRMSVDEGGRGMIERERMEQGVEPSGTV